MKTRVKLFIRLLLIILAIGSVAAVVEQHSAVAGLRAENQAQLEDSQEAARLAQENAVIGKLRKENEEVTKLRLENRELPKLRNEVRQLRKQVEEMAKLRAENQRLSGQPANDPGQSQRTFVWSNNFTKESLQERGMRLPVMTLQTFFSALIRGDVNRAMECLTPDAAAKMQANPGQNGVQGLLQLTNGFTGFQITERNQPAPDEIVLGVKLTGTGDTEAIHFKLVGTEWKMNP